MTVARAGRGMTTRRRALGGRGAAVAWVGALLVAAMLFGGSARVDVVGTILVRLTAILAGCWALALAARDELRAVRTPLFLLAILAIVEAAQLIPLPPALWTALPGRALFAGLADAAGFAQPWRPLSITPDLTLDALLGLAVPAAMLLCAARLPDRGWFWLLLILLALGVLSALVGLAQVATGARALYFYRVTNPDSAVGLFANRNHQAVFLALCFPLLATFALYPTEAIARSRRLAAAGLVGVLFVPLLMVTGSRAGLALMLIGFGAIWLLWSSGGGAWRAPRRAGKRRPRAALDPRVIGLLVAVLVLIGVTIAMSRAVAVQRLFTQDLAQERRVALFEPMLAMLWSYFPAGAGFGGFADVFRIAEPFSNLNPRYMNHAHNDWLEFVFEGGLPALLLLLGFIAWYARASFGVWRRRRWGQQDRAAMIGRLGSVQVAMLSIASLADYPLRTPSLAAVFALACAFLAAGQERGGQVGLDADTPLH